MNNQKPLITVATITYNSAKWVQQTIDSVLAQSFRDFELLICDDCSTDNSWEIINAFNHPQIRKYKNENNIGEYPNRNKVLDLATGDYIIYIDGDDILYKDSLERFARYVEKFPEAGGIWGVSDVFYDFIVFPYLFEPKEITKLIFLSSYPITIVGFAESLFKVSAMKAIGGFDNQYAIGDTYIKKRIACEYPILLTTRGYTFWRQTNNQASKKVVIGYRNLIENYNINVTILNSSYFPFNDEVKQTILANIQVSAVKLIIKNSLLKGNLFRFFKLMNKLNIPVNKINLIVKKIDLSYKCNASGEKPLINDYNFLNKL